MQSLIENPNESWLMIKRFVMNSKSNNMVVGGCLAGITAVVAVCLWAFSDVAKGTPRVAPTEKGWHAVAPGRIEPASGEIRIASAIPGVVGDVLVKVNDKVFAGEPLIRLHDNELRARLAGAEQQVALRKRARNDQLVVGKAADRRKAEDAVADAERALIDVRSALDKTVADLRAGRAKPADINAARTALAQAQDQVVTQKAELRKAEADTPLPSMLDGQLNVARSELQAAEAAVEKLTIRAPISGSVLQISVKPGELAMPSALAPLVLLGDISSLRVRAELDERDFGGIKIGQMVTVRSQAFLGRDFVGKVASLAPLVEHGRGGLRGARNPSDVDVVEVVVDLSEPGPLTTGMKVDAYFSR